MKQFIVAAHTFLVALFVFGANGAISAQEGTFPMCAGGDSIQLSSEFDPGAVEITQVMREEVISHIPSVQAHVRGENTCIAVYGTSDEMDWQNATNPTQTDSLDALVSYVRGWVVGQLVRREAVDEITPDFPVRVAALAGDLNRGAVIVLGHLIDVNETSQLDIDELTRRIREVDGRIDELAGQFVISSARIEDLENRTENLEGRADDHEARLTALEEMDKPNIWVEAGVAFGASEGYRMPQLELGVAIGESRPLVLSGWLGRSLRSSEGNFLIRGDTVTSDVRKWGYGGNATYYFTPLPYACGPTVGYLTYEDRIDKADEFASRKRGFTIGAECRINVFNRVHIVFAPGWEFYSKKKAEGVIGESETAENTSGIRATFGIRIPLTSRN